MDTAAVLAAADRLFAARIERKPVEMLPEYCKPQDETEAYVIQSTVGLLKKAALPFTPMRSDGAVRGHRISDDFRMRWARVAP